MLSVGAPSFFLALEPSSERAAGNFLKRILLRAGPGALAVTVCSIAAMIFNRCGMPFEISATVAVLSAGVIGIANLILTCRPFTKLRTAVCIVMSLGFAGAVACFPSLFYLRVYEMNGTHWGVAAAMTACGLAVLLGASRLVRPWLEKLAKKR